MFEFAYIYRILFASFGALIVTILLIFLIMWMNGFIEDDNPDNAVVYSICNFDKNLPKETLNPFIEKEINIKCSNKDDKKSLILEWFEKLFAEDFDKGFIRKNNLK